jgi:MFS family permease
LTRDGCLLFGTRFARLFAFGVLAVVLGVYLKAVGLSEGEIGLLFSLTLLGDTVISLWLTTRADRIGRRKTLLVGAVLMVLAGVLFAFSGNFWILLVAATIGVISPSGNEVGPFLSIEQAALSQTISHAERTEVFAWYNLTGSVATALGALAGGVTVSLLQEWGLEGVASYQPLPIVYAFIGLLLAVTFVCLSPATEAPPSMGSAATHFGLGQSAGTVWKLAALFSLDAFGGGFVVQGLLAYWFYVRFEVDPATLGGIFFGANLLAAGSSLAAAWLARRIGLVNTMVFTHLPSNVLLMLVPLMPNLPLAIAVLLLRFSISQMDVPTRQSYTMAVVRPEERSAASGLTGVARSVGAAVSPSLAGVLLMVPALINWPFYLAGGIKIVYDVLLYRSFVTTRPPEESESG